MASFEIATFPGVVRFLEHLFISYQLYTDKALGMEGGDETRQPSTNHPVNRNSCGKPINIFASRHLKPLAESDSVFCECCMADMVIECDR